MRALRLFALLVVAGTASACMTGDGMQTKLRDASTEYNKSLRWRDLDRAAEWLPADSQQAFLARQDEYALAAGKADQHVEQAHSRSSDDGSERVDRDQQRDDRDRDDRRGDGLH